MKRSDVIAASQPLAEMSVASAGAEEDEAGQEECDVKKKIGHGYTPRATERGSFEMPTLA